MKPATAIVIEAEATEQQLVERAKAAENNAFWIVGQCASEWTQRYAKGRTDADFAKLIGKSPESIAARRRVFETFGDVRESYAALDFSHFRAAVAWDDAAECLSWANEHEASYREMEAWRRAQGSSQVILDDCDDEPVADHECDANELVDHKTDCASDNVPQPEDETSPSQRTLEDNPDRTERETPVTRKPEVSRLADFRESIRAMQKLSEQHEQHGARDQLESLAKFHEVRAFKIRKRLEGHS